MNLNLQLVNQHPERSWDWYVISYKASIEEIKQYPHLKWNPEGISCNKNLTLEFILSPEFPVPLDKLNWTRVSWLPLITLKDVEQHPELPWIGEGLSANPNLTPEFVERHFLDWIWIWKILWANQAMVSAINNTNYDYWPRDIKGLSQNPKLPLDLVLKNPDWDWGFISLVSRPDFTLEMALKLNINKGAWSLLLQYIDIDIAALCKVARRPELDWRIISSRANVTMEQVLKYAHWPWVWDELAVNPNFTLADMIGAGHLKPNTWFKLSFNPNTTEADVEKHLGAPWFWHALSRNLPIDCIERHPDWPWDWQGMSFHPNLTAAFVARHANKPWRWDAVTRHRFPDTEEYPELPWDWSEYHH